MGEAVSFREPGRTDGGRLESYCSSNCDLKTNEKDDHLASSRQNMSFVTRFFKPAVIISIARHDGS